MAIFEPNPTSTTRNMTATMTAGETLAQYDIVYGDTATGRIKKAQNDNTSAEANAIGIVTQSGGISNGNTGEVTLSGTVTNAAWTLTTTAEVFVGSTYGAITQTVPSLYVKPIGIALSATSIHFNFLQPHWKAAIETPDPFGSGVLLDLSRDPALGTASNLGYLGSAGDFDVIGSFTKYALGSSYYWEAGANTRLQQKPLHSHATTTAAFVSITLTAGSASIVLSDTANNLETLYEFTRSSLHFRPYKICVTSDQTSVYVTGYIGDITKSGDNYTFLIYNAATGTTRDWISYGSGWTGTNVKWWIVPAFYEADGSARNQYTWSCWFQLPTVSTEMYLMGKLGWGTSQQWGYGMRTDTGTSNFRFERSWGNYSDMGGAQSGRWYHLAYGQEHGGAWVICNGGSPRVQASSVSPGVSYSLATFGGSMAQNTYCLSGARIAFPRFWSQGVPGATMMRLYHYERELLGLPINH